MLRRLGRLSLRPQRQRGPALAQARVRLAPALAELRARMQPYARDGLARALSLLGATRPRRFARGALTAVTFHRVLPAERLRQYPLAGLAVTPEQLQAILGQLAQHFACAPLIDAYRSWQRQPGAERPALGITFDDGSLDNYEHARPVLDRLGLKASFYIPVGLVEERRCPWHDRLGFALVRSAAAIRKRRELDFEALLAPFGLSRSAFAAVLPADALTLAAQGVAAAKQLGAEPREQAIAALERALGGDQVPDWAGLMSWQQIRELGAQGHEIGSHSLTHPLLTDLDAEQLEREVVRSRSQLADAAGCEVASFCYPNGSYDTRALQAVQAAGYDCAVTTRWGLNRGGSAHELLRCDMDYARLQSRNGEFSAQRLWLRLSGLQPGLKSAPLYAV
jgi:peptidoglycan/xylan/chitin deacetylase (PgdA/CDA1 family)